ncbi:type III-A CRISPR-associated RAMP protein Csm5, partial [Persephonella sp.]
NNKLQIYDFDKVVRALKDNPQRLINLTADIERNPLNKNLGDFLKNYRINVEPSYSVEIKGEIKRKKRNQNNTEYKPIWEFIKENGKVYIPGTEIKGAIRTALFYKILKDKFTNDEKIKDQFLKEYENCLSIKDFKDDRDKKKQIKKKFSNFEQKWESIVFRAGFQKSFDKNFKFADAKKDILKILVISDTDLKFPNEVLTIVDVTAIGVSRNFEELHEVLRVGTEFITDLKVPFKDEFKKIFPETYVFLGMKKIREACSELAVRILEEDIEYFKNSKELKSDEKAKILGKLEERKAFAVKCLENKFVILRLGKHQGFLSTTINLLVKELDPELYSRAYKYLVPNGYPEFPNKSRKLTIDNQLLGWCVLVPEG